MSPRMHSISRRCYKLWPLAVDSVPPQTIISLPVQTAVCRIGHQARWWCWWLSNIRAGIVSAAGVQNGYVASSAPDDHFTAGPDCRVTTRAVGALVVLVAVQLFVLGLYLPPVLKFAVSRSPQTIISLPVQTAVCRARAAGALVVLVAVQLSVPGCISRRCSKRSCVYSTPDDHFTAGPDCRVSLSARWARWWCWWPSNYPCWDCISRRCSRTPGCINSAPDDHFAAGPHCRVSSRRAGALVVLVAVQLFVPGLYLPPVFKRIAVTISTPDDHFTAGPDCRVPIRPEGALVVLVAVQLSVLGLYLPPVFKIAPPSTPPQTIISLPVQTAV